MTTVTARVEPLGQHALFVRLSDRIDDAANAHVHALARRLLASAPAAVRDIVPAYASLAVHFREGRDAAAVRAALAAWLERALEVPDDEAIDTITQVVDVPVCYGGEHGPDLADVAAHAGLSIDDVVQRHVRGDYRVAMVGFAPGFPYLLGMDRALAMPRLDAPRARIAAGSVGIAEAQTGIYPQASPGGWRLIGRTPLALFDATREPPSLLRPGDRVRFVAIDAEAFARMARPST